MTRPFRFARPNRRLTESELRDREAAHEYAKRHAECEDDPCDECGGTFCRWCGDQSHGEEFCSSACKGKSDAEADDAGRSLVLDTVGTFAVIVAVLFVGGCGGKDPGPCLEAGTYCVDQTLCLDGEPTDCAAVAGGACNPGMRQVGGPLVIQATCIVRPPPPTPVAP